MPAVHSKSLLHLTLRVFGANVKIIRAAKIILGSSSANRRKGLVAVHKKLDFALAPPSVIVDAPRKVGSDVMALTGNAVNFGNTTRLRPE